MGKFQRDNKQKKKRQMSTQIANRRINQKCYTNFFPVKLNVDVYVYKMEISPSPSNMMKIARRFLRENREEIKEKLGDFYIPMNAKIFSKCSAEGMEFTNTFDDITYELSIISEGNLTDQNQAMQIMFTARIFKILQGKMRLKLFGRNYFNPDQAVRQGNLEVWPGYKLNLKCVGEKFYLNVDSASKVLRRDTVYDLICNLREKIRGDFETKIKNEIEGTSIITHYNRRIYRIDDVDFNKTPKDTFKMFDGTEKSYIEYYEEKYKIKIRDQNQPLLICRLRKGRLKEMHLVPELCLTTGLNDRERRDRTLMQNLSSLIKPNCGQRYSKSASFAKFLKTKDKALQMLKDWGIEIGEEGQNLNALQINPGNMLMGNSKKLQLLNPGNLDRESQTKMYSAKPIKKIVVFYPSICEREKTTLLNNLDNSLRDFEVDCNLREALVLCEIRRDRDDREWINCSREKLGPDVNLAIYILKGPKTGNRTYKAIKRFIMNEAPVPCQVVNAKTLAGRRNMRSIVNKILIQINAKLGGIPWAVDNLPFSDKPTMVLGISTLLKGSVKRSVSVVATMDRRFCKYWSCFEHLDDSDENVALANAIYNAIKEFDKTNGIFPHRIFAYREGVGGLKNNPTVKNEISALQDAINRYLQEKFEAKKEEVDEAKEDKEEGKKEEEASKLSEKVSLIPINLF